MSDSEYSDDLISSSLDRLKVNLARSYVATDEPHRAIPLLEDIYNRQAAKTNPAAGDSFSTASVLVKAYAATRDFERAAALQQRCADALSKSLGPNHFKTITALLRLARTHQEGGCSQRAIPLFQEVYEWVEKRYGPEHPRAIMVRGEMAVAHHDSGDSVVAVSMLEEAIARRWTDPTDLPLPELATLAEWVMEGGDYQRAEMLLRACLSIRVLRKPDDWQTDKTRFLLGLALLKQTRFTDAERLLLAGYQGMKEKFANIPVVGRFRLAEASDRLAQLYDATHRPAEAAKWRAERLKYPPEVAPPPRPAKP